LWKLADAKDKELLWRGSVTDTITDNSNKNINNLDKAVVKLFRAIRRKTRSKARRLLEVSGADVLRRRVFRTALSRSMGVPFRDVLACHHEWASARNGLLFCCFRGPLMSGPREPLYELRATLVRRMQ